ncbi:MAG TPA: hypothetical protein VFX49_09345 [Chloroflexota bacterium]|nr:hypothetical protein [Chloroflexota bacterium]
MRATQRRTVLRALPQGVALAAAYAFGAVSVSESTRTQAACPVDAAAEPQPLTRPTESAQLSAPRRAQTLPLPTEDEHTWLQEWLDLVALPTRKAAHGC